MGCWAAQPNKVARATDVVKVFNVCVDFIFCPGYFEYRSGWIRRTDISFKTGCVEFVGIQFVEMDAPARMKKQLGAVLNIE